MAKLVKIIMIHGHMPGVVELDLDGHTNICGSNASGKTTLQRMIPVFYGELPNRVVPRTRLSFDAYYLPHKNSYVIYEYERPRNGLAQVVLSKRADGVDYRFVDAPYQPEQYLLEHEGGVLAREYQDWANDMRHRGIDISAKISSTTEYRSIILNDIKNDRSNRSESLRHRQLASRYSLSPDKHSLRHIEKLVSAVHAKEGKMDTLKSMLAAILEEDGYQRPANTMTGDKIRSWLTDMKQFMKMDTLHQSLEEIERISGERAAHLATLWQLKKLLETDNGAQRQCRADTEQAIQALKRAIAAAEDDYRQRRGELIDTKSDAGSALQSSQQHLDNAQRQYDRYRDADIERVGRELTRLPERRSELQGLEQHYRLMMEAHQGAERELQEHRLQLTEQLKRASDQLQAQINDKNTEQKRIHAAELDATKDMNQQLQQAQEKVRTHYQQELTQLQTELAGKRAQHGLSMLNAEEMEQMRLVELRVDNAQQQLEQHRQQLSTQQGVLANAQQQREQAAASLTSARSAAAQGQQRIEQLEQQLQPSAGSLRQFLTQHVEHWQYSFGRVLAEPLLQRTDLEPQLQQEQQDTVFGVQLDLHAVELPEHALTDEHVREQLEQVIEQWQRQRQQSELAEKALAKAVADVKQQQEALELAHQQHRRLESDVSYARDHRQRLLHEQAQLDAARQAAVRERIQQLQAQLEHVEHQRQANLTAVDSEYQERALELTAEYQEQQQILQDAIDELHSERERIEANTKERLQELERAFSAKLAEQGVDEHTLQQLKQTISGEQEHIRQIEAQRDAYTEYQQFMQVTWQRLRPQWLATEQQAKQELREAETALERHEADYKNTQRSRDAQLTQLNERLDKAEQHVQVLKGLLARMEELPMALEPAQAMTGLEQGDVSERSARAYELLEEKHRLDKALETGIHTLETDIRKDSDQQFVTFMEASFAKLEPAPDMQARVNVLKDIIDVLEGKQQQTIEQGKTIGAQLFKFFTVFNDIHKRVSDYSRRLTQAVGDELNLEGIDKAEVKISSTIDELGFWQPLKEMTYHYQQWQSSGEPLPTNDYLEHLSDVASLLKTHQEYSIESLLKLQLNLIENGEPVIIRNDRQLTDSSSNGMAYLILCKFLLAFTRLLRPADAGVTLHWPIDELGTLAYHNVEKLFIACSQNDIDILGAFPNAESDVLQLFKHKYLIEPHAELPNKGQLKRIKPRVSELTQKLQQLQRNVRTPEVQA